MLYNFIILATRWLVCLFYNSFFAYHLKNHDYARRRTFCVDARSIYIRHSKLNTSKIMTKRIISVRKKYKEKQLSKIKVTLTKKKKNTKI